jgi:hypothetical protein
MAERDPFELVGVENNVVDEIKAMRMKLARTFRRNLQMDAASDVMGESDVPQWFGEGDPTDAAGTLASGYFIFPAGLTIDGVDYLCGQFLNGVLEWGARLDTGKLVYGGGNNTLGSEGATFGSGADVLINELDALGYPSDYVTYSGVTAIVHDTANDYIFMGGSFTFLGGVFSPGLIGYNMTTRTFFAVPNFIAASAIAVTGDTVLALAISGSTLYVGGNFVNAGGISTADYLCAVDTTTLAISSITTGTPLTGITRALLVDSGVLYVAGSALNMTGIASADYIAKYTIGSATWASITASSQLNNIVRALALHSGKLIVGGDFTDAFGTATSDRIVLYDIAGGTWSGISGQLNGAVTLLKVSGTKVYVAGSFTNANGTATEDYLTAYDLDAAAWAAVAAGLSTNTDVLECDAEYLYVLDSISSPLKIKRMSLNTGVWSDYYECGIAGGEPSTLYVDGDGNLWVGGTNTVLNGLSMAGSQLAVRWKKLRDELRNHSAMIRKALTYTNGPEGMCSNYQIAVSVSGGDLTLALTDSNGVAFSATNPLRFRTQNEYYETYDDETGFTSLSFTVPGSSSYLNAASSELSGKAINYFVYLVWNSVKNAAMIGYSRVPYFKTYADVGAGEFGWVTQALSTPASTDKMIVIGRFTATQTTGTNDYSISGTGDCRSYPMYETDWLSWTPTLTGFSSNPTSAAYSYKIIGNVVHFYIVQGGNGTSNSTGYTLTLPFTSLNDASHNPWFPCLGVNNGALLTTPAVFTVGSTATATIFRDWTTAAWTNVNGKRISNVCGFYRIG